MTKPGIGAGLPRTCSLTVLLLLLTCLTPRPAIAGTDAGLVFQPWDPRQHLELNAGTIFESVGAVSPGRNLGINLYHEDFSLRPIPTDPHQFAFGSDVTGIDIRGARLDLPPRLVDQSYAFGLKLGPIHRGWELGLVAGIGYSGSTPYIDNDSLYAKGSLVAVHKIDAQTNLAVIVDYDGNRTWLPDWPIPTIVYQHVEGKKLAYVIGLPVAALHWMPDERTTLDFSYTPLAQINAGIEYEFIKQWKLYAAYETREYAFHRDRTDPARRIFFQQQRAEVGLRWQPLLMLRLAVGGGFAFNQKFTRGWDLRSTTKLVDLHDEPYLRLQATLYF